MTFNKLVSILLIMSFTASLFALTIDSGVQEWPPYTHYEGPQNRGIMIEVFSQIAKKLGHPVNVVKLTEERGISDLNLEMIDVRPKAKEWIKNASAYQWTNSVMKVDDIMILPKARPILQSKN